MGIGCAGNITAVRTPYKDLVAANSKPVHRL